MLCRELYRVLSIDSHAKVCRLTFAPNQPGLEESFFILQETTGIEIVCFKNTYLSIFKEAHSYFENYQSISGCPKNWNTYYVSLGYLLTTPENKTNFNVHYDTFSKLWSIDGNRELLDNELRIVQRLLTSSNNRLNKSSSLWLMYKKLYGLTVHSNEDVDHDYILTFLESGSKHLSNYYCWNASRWFFDALPSLQKKLLINNTKQFCFKNLKDASSWDALAYMLCQQKRRINYNITSLPCSSNVDQTIVSVDCSWFRLQIDNIFTEIVHLIDSFSVAELPPFLCCRTITLSFPQLEIVKTTLERWESDTENFEQRYGPPQYIRKNPVPDSKYTDDFIVSGLSRHIGYKKRLVRNNL